MIELKSIEGVVSVMNLPLSDSTQCKLLDFTKDNAALAKVDLTNTDEFSSYINHQLEGFKCGIGGYLEPRVIYSRSELFDEEEPRSLHLGVDLWAVSFSRVFAPIDGVVHSFKFNHAFGDYGPTLIIKHDLNGLIFYTLYGHLSLASLDGKYEGMKVKVGEEIAQLGEPRENVGWPPHLHFQIIKDLQGEKGDYPGVCKPSEIEFYKENCPNPNFLLRTEILD